MSALPFIKVDGYLYQRVAEQKGVEDPYAKEKRDPDFKKRPIKLLQLLNRIRLEAHRTEEELNRYLSREGELPYTEMSLASLLEQIKNGANNTTISAVDEALTMLNNSEG